MAKDLTIGLEDRPGTLADAAEALGKAGINIEGICGFPSGGRGVGHVLVEDAAAARQALEGAGVIVEGERDVVVVDAPDQPGELGRIARKIASVGINVDLLYVASRTRVVIGASDPEGARRTLGM